MRVAYIVLGLFFGFLFGVPVGAGPVPCEVAARQEPAPPPKPADPPAPAPKPADPPAPAPKPADPPAPARLSIGGATEWEPFTIVKLNAQGLPPKAGQKWKVKPIDDPAAKVSWATGRNVVSPEWVAPPGRYAVELSAGWLDADGILHLDDVEVTVTIKAWGPTPLPQPPPKIDPKKVDPVTPPAPKPGANLRVLIVRESGSPRPVWLSSPAVLEYLKRKCAKGPAGHPEWREYDPQQVVSDKESPTMKAMWEATKPNLGQLPQIAVATDTSGQLYPLPADEASALQLLKQYGGE